MLEPNFMKLGMYIMTSEPISVAYFTNSSHQSACNCIPPVVARQRLGKHVPASMNICNNKRITERVILYAIRVLSKESLWVCVASYRCYVTTRQRRSRGNEELLAASFSMRSGSYQSNVGD
jgi:hypothetical protein